MESIQTVYTVSQILDKEVSKSSGGGTEHAILYGYITALDLDADEGIVVSRWWVEGQQKYYNSFTNSFRYFQKFLRSSILVDLISGTEHFVLYRDVVTP